MTSNEREREIEINTVLNPSRPERSAARAGEQTEDPAC